ncbi:MAG: GIY-YIG nuclease family protein [Fulvivirga sp.]|nr:GIY-YIG nuclease family protein [Fulvivirga sp.]
MSYFVYILQSEKTKALYKGQTHDLDKRLAHHNAGKVRSTKAARPWKIVAVFIEEGNPFFLNLYLLYIKYSWPLKKPIATIH